jgi:hypothetical protein
MTVVICLREAITLVCYLAQFGCLFTGSIDVIAIARDYGIDVAQ